MRGFKGLFLRFAGPTLGPKHYTIKELFLPIAAVLELNTSCTPPFRPCAAATKFLGQWTEKWGSYAYGIAYGRP